MKNIKAEINDTELEEVNGAGEYTAFVDSDDYEEKETYETACKSAVKGSFPGHEISPLN